MSEDIEEFVKRIDVSTLRLSKAPKIVDASRYDILRFLKLLMLNTIVIPDTDPMQLVGGENNNLNVSVRSSTTRATVAGPQTAGFADAGLTCHGAIYGYPGTGSSVELIQTNSAQTAFASANRAVATYNSAALTVVNQKGVTVVVDITSIGAAGTLQIIVQVRDEVDTTKWATIATFSVDTAVGTYAKQVYPGISVVAAVNGYESFARTLGRTMRVQAIVAVNAVTFSVSAVLMN